MVVNKCSIVILTLALLLLSPCATSLTFEFPSFPDNGNNTLSLEGDAFIDGKFLGLTKTALEHSQNVSVGRATYTEPFLLRESATGNLANFSTSFTFVIDSRNRSAYGDGLAFFLAPVGTSLRNSSARYGASLGLPFNTTLSNDYPYVAVEFDVFQFENTATEDLGYFKGHVGIDVSSLNSVTTKPWYVSMKEGPQSINSAKISYSSGTKNLSVAFTTSDDLNGTQVISYLSYRVDLTKYLTDWVVVGFSSSTGRSTALHSIISWNFTSTSLVDYDLVPTPGLGSEVKPRKHKRHVAVFIGSIVGGFMLVGVLGLGLFNSCKRKVTGESTQSSSTDIKGLRRFSYGEIALATRNFSEGEKLGDGGDGEFYKGFRYDMNSYVTVKRMSMGSTISKENKAELKFLSIFSHRNLMNLIGWCDEQGELLLVFECMPKGTLDFYLRKADNLLIWEVRYKIAQDLASALLYVHREGEPCVAHMNIQSSNIMLDSNFSAKLGNFLFTRSPEQSLTALMIGIQGYTNPEYVLTGMKSKIDVYSFGIVALEIACGRKPIDTNMSNISLVQWVWELYREGKIIEAADPKLRGDFDKKQMECLLVVGLWCTNCDSSFRPSIREAIQVLHFEAPLPLLILSNDTTGSNSQRSTSESSNFSSDSANSLPWGQIDQPRISARSRWRRLSLIVRGVTRIKRSGIQI